ncbi:MAG: aminomethyl-transferring glycine dehydrogenase subunit GcvPB, partial [bacterium]|nr:aminomethyl-transferring glycine dehydrogenase subunit GcvPB [bacterium]
MKKFLLEFKERSEEYLPREKAGLKEFIPEKYLNKEKLGLPEVSEVSLVRHLTDLSRNNFGVDNGFYPLGSCTMKYNPKINEKAGSLEGFRTQHPLMDEEYLQGDLELLYRMESFLKDISGMDAVTFQPAAGAHGEITGILLVRAYHDFRKDLKRKNIIVPDSSHGTNPASASLAGFKVVEIKSNPEGLVDLGRLKAVLNDETACLMLTNPNTLGLFEKDIVKISKMVHEAGALLYYDGANLNPLLGRVRVADMGFDIVHFNLHKSFSTPHGGGGPGSGPVGVKAGLADFLPVPYVKKEKDRYSLACDREHSIGRVHSFHGNFNVIVKAYFYILELGIEGLRAVSEKSIL